MENYAVPGRRITRTATSAFAARTLAYSNDTPIAPVKTYAVRLLDTVEDVFLIDSRCFVRTVSRSGAQSAERYTEPQKLKASFSARKLLKMQDYFADGRYMRQHQIVNYDGQLAYLRRQNLQHNKELNHAAKRKAEESDQFSRLYALRRALIRK